MISSFSKFFTREHYEPKSSGSPGEEPNNKDCFPCMATSAVLILGLGSWFASGMVFEGQSKPVKLSPAYVRGVKGLGFILIPLGVFRSWQAYEAWGKH